MILDFICKAFSSAQNAAAVAAIIVMNSEVYTQAILDLPQTLQELVHIQCA